MKFSRKTFAFVLGLALILAISLSAYSKTDAQTTQEQVDQLLADYQKALEYELAHGQTVEVDDPDFGKTRELTGESLAKLETLWDETQRQINELVARPEEERAKVVQLIQSIEPGEVTYLRQSSMPYYDPDAKVEIYMTAKNRYSVDIATGQIIEIVPVQKLKDEENAVSQDSVVPIYSQAELEQKARDLIVLATGGLDLNSLTPNFGSKLTENKQIQNFFFRWENTVFVSNGGMAPFIQIGFSQTGEFLNYVNTLHLDLASSLAPYNTSGLLVPQFTEVYRNNKSPYWKTTIKIINGIPGVMNTKPNAGWCYINRNIYPSLCPSSLWNFRYTFEKYEWDVQGRWLPNPNSNVEASAFIPSTNAYAPAKYYVYSAAITNNWTIDQSDWFNTWVVITQEGSVPDINKIRLENAGSPCVCMQKMSVAP